MRALCSWPLALAAVVLLAGAARAESVEGGGTALDQLDPAPAGDAFFGVPSPFVGGQLTPRAVVVFDYARQPLAIADGAQTRELVTAQGFVHVNASLAIADRLVISALLPVALLQSGEDTKVQGVTFRLQEPVYEQASDYRPAVGDLRLGARVRFFGEEHDVFQAAGGLALHLPTGPSGTFAAGSFVGEGGVRLAPQIVLGGRHPRFLWSAMGGAVLRGSDNPSTLVYGAGAAVVIGDDRLEIGPEIFASTAIQDKVIRIAATKSIERTVPTNVEALLGARLHLASFLVGAGVGAGLSQAIGTPEMRLVGTMGYSPRPEASPASASASGDADGDGIAGAADACPFSHGPKSADAKRNGCPAPDADEDGVADPDDACPDVAGAAATDAKKSGCPLDTDADGVPDALDLCPKDAGAEEKNGCPAASVEGEAATKSAEDAAKPADGAAKPADGAAKPADGAGKPADGAAKPADGAAKPADSAAKPVNGTTKPASGGTKQP